jgi:cobalt-zinc-cadmium efflux system outer membrane protein
MDLVTDVPAYEDVRALLAQNPNVARWAEEMKQRLAALALERARRVPDLSVGIGVQRFEETGAHALTFGLSLPLPLFDRNQGGVLEARHRLAQAGHERKSAEVRTAAAIAESYETLTAARSEVIGLKDQVVPGAVKAFDAANEGYRQGKFGYLEVLDAQRTLFEARGRLLDGQARYHRSVAIVESLIGAKLESLQDRERKER